MGVMAISAKARERAIISGKLFVHIIVHDEEAFDMKAPSLLFSLLLGIPS